jgi:glycine/D-amino acid oxidase-like deaminating enzyme
MGSTGEINPSLWMTTAPPDQQYPRLEGEIAVDVAVVGAGITGVVTAVLLKQAGASVALVEAGHLCAGVTGYTTAKVTALHGLTYAGLAATGGEEAAGAYVRRQCRGPGDHRRAGDGLQPRLRPRTPPGTAYTTDPRRKGDVEAEVEAARRAGLAATFVTDTELPFPVGGGHRPPAPRAGPAEPIGRDPGWAPTPPR